MTAEVSGGVEASSAVTTLPLKILWTLVLTEIDLGGKPDRTVFTREAGSPAKKTGVALVGHGVRGNSGKRPSSWSA